MIINPLMKFLGAKELPESAQHLIQKAVISFIAIQMFFGLSSTFYVLFIIDSVGYEMLGLLLAASFVLQAVLDYPSGVLGDWIGQRWLLLVAYLSFGMSYGLLFFATSFDDLLVVYCLQAFASSQASGALETWIDNNYKIAAGETDPDRKIYMVFFGRYSMIGQMVMGISFIAGGMLATIDGRQAVFAVQAVTLMILAFAFLSIIKDLPGVERSEKSAKNYFKLMGGGLKVVFMNKVIIIFVLGICMRAIVWTVWGNMILFPMYFGYTGSDAGASMYRFIVFIAGIPIIGLSATIAAKLNVKWQAICTGLHSLLFFGSFIVITSIFPFNDIFEPFALLLALFVFSTLNIVFFIADVLEHRIFLDLIPDQNRNAVYSLIPTLTLLVTAPTIIIGGVLLTSWGVTATLMFLGSCGLIAASLFYVSLSFLSPETLVQETAVEEAVIST